MRPLLAAVILVLPLSLAAQQTPAATPESQAPTAAEQPSAKPAPEEPKSQPEKETAKPEPAKKEVPPEAPVITLSGACPQAGDAKQQGTADACKTVVTRAEFEQIANALAPDAPEAARRQIAETYAQALVVNNEAVKEGVQNDPGAEEVFKYARMRAMGQLLARRVQQNAMQVSDEEIKKYFEQNRQNFAEAVLTRIVVPKRTGTKQKPATPAMEKAYAERIRRRLVAGAKPSTLQAEAFKRAGVKTPPPEANVGSVRRDALPPNQTQVFELKPGEVSPVLDEHSAAFIYRVEAKTTPELDPTVADEIRKTIASERLQNEAKRIGQSAVPTFNPDYFGKENAAQPALPGVTVPTEEPPSPE